MRIWTGAIFAAMASLGGLAKPPAEAAPPIRDVWGSLRPPLRAFGLSEGTPNMSVYAVSQDRSGRLWVGTQDGSAFYNGRSWTSLSLPPQSPSQFVRAVVETPEGSRWFGTEGGGLWRFKDGSWTQFREGKGFSSNSVHSLTVVPESEGTWSLWVATSDAGVARFDGTRWTFMNTQSGLPSNSVWKIRVLGGAGPSGTLWAATTKGYARYRGGRWEALGAKEGWPEGEANDISEILDRNGGRQYWLSLWGVGLLSGEAGHWERWNPSTGTFPSYFPITQCVVPDLDGNPVLWVSTYDRGVAWLSHGQWRSLDTRMGLPSNGIYSLYAPDRGKPTLWMGLRGGGLVSLDLGGWYGVDREMGLPSNEVHAFAETRDAKGGSTLWIGTSEGLVHWDGAAWRLDTQRTGLPHDHVTSLLVTQEARGPEFWAGTMKGLAKWTGSRWSTLYETRGLQDERILCLLETRNAAGDLVLWAGTDKGLLRIEKGQKTFLTAKDGLPDSQVYSLASTRDPEGGESIWVGTRGRGIGRMKGGKWRTYGEGQGLINLSVFCFREARSRDGRRWLWAGTFGGGVVRLNLDDPKADRWEAFTGQNLPGLPSNVVVRIEASPDGRLYLATQRGVARLSFQDPTDPARPSGVESFTGGDGLAPVSCNYGASLLDHAGRVWVATNRGAAALDPKLEMPPPPIPDLVLDHVMVGGQAGSLDPRGTVLPYHRNQLSFEVSLPSFHREEDVLYRTQLVGVEPAPTSWSVNNRRELVALPVGSYLLHLEAMDHLGRRARPLDFPIRVKPAPWASPWAYGVYLLLVAGGMAGIYRMRTRILRTRNLELEARVAQATGELKEKNQTLERLNEEKNQFMGIAAHDLKNPLNAVVLAAQQIAEGDMDLEELNHFAGMIERAARQMGDLIKNMLDVNRMDTGALLLNIQKVNLSALAGEVQRDFESRAGAKQISLGLEAPEDVMVRADPLHIRDVLENFVSNAIKFTAPGPPESRVTIRIRREGSRVLMEVQDQGPGLSDEDKAKAFGRFTRLSARPTAGEGSSGLGLSIVKRLVEAMDGDVGVDSVVGRGATFWVLLPDGDEA